MNRKTILFTLLMAIMVPLCLPATAAAQAKKGDTEILLFGNFSLDPKSASDSSTGTFFFNIGNYIGELLQVGGGPSIIVSSGGEGVDTTVGFNAFLRQYFGRGAKVSPYLGGEFFMGDLENSDSSFINIIGGVKNYFSERAAVDLKGAYGFSTTSSFGERAQQLQFSVGLTILF